MPTTAAPGPSKFSRGQFGWLIVLLSAIGIAVYFPSEYTGGSLASLAEKDVGLADTYTAKTLPVQVFFYLHVTFAGLALLVGGFQFSKKLRSWHLTIHRWIGRVYIGAVLIGGVSAFVIAFFNSVAYLGFFGFATLAVLWLGSTVKGYRAIRSGDVRSHQAWMIRSFALTYAAVMLRTWLIVLILVQVLFGKTYDEAFDPAYAPVPFLCWLPNIVVAEWIIARKGLPGFGFQRRPGTADAPVAAASPARSS